MAQSRAFAVTERGDYSRYLAGRYVEHLWREARGWFDGEAGSPLSGKVYLLQGSVRDQASSSREVAASLSVGLGLGRFAAIKDVSFGDFPSHRGLMAGAPERLEAGVSWTAPATFAFSLKEGVPSFPMPVLVEYRVDKPGLLGGKPVIAIRGLFALRHPSMGSHNASLDSAGVVSLAGKHELDLYLDAEDRSLLFIRDHFEENIAFGSGPAERRTGFILVFSAGSPSPDRGAQIAALSGRDVGAPLASSAEGPALAAALPPAGSPGSAAAVPASPLPQAEGQTSIWTGPGPFVAGTGDILDESPVADTPLAKAGVDIVDAGTSLVLRVRDLRFVPDGDEILSGERWRLDAIHDALAALTGRNFLVEGHAAAVGKSAGELELSRRRAKRVVDELVARGIAASRFIWRGLGSTLPLAPNDTEENRAKNRRVEITILD